MSVTGKKVCTDGLEGNSWRNTRISSARQGAHEYVLQLRVYGSEILDSMPDPRLPLDAHAIHTMSDAVSGCLAMWSRLPSVLSVSAWQTRHRMHVFHSVSWPPWLRLTMWCRSSGGFNHPHASHELSARFMASFFRRRRRSALRMPFRDCRFTRDRFIAAWSPWSACHHRGRHARASQPQRRL